LVLVGYATRYGSTQEVAEAIAATLRECGLAVELQPLREVRTLERYSAVVLGAPLFMFRWHKDALRFLSRYPAALMERPVAVFALGPTHDPYDEKEWQDSRAQLDKELAKYPWLTPVALEMFGGKYDPAKLGFPIKGLAGKEPASDIRDWAAIRAWASNLAAKLEPALPLSSDLA
jgi:menaquinone-dependent protoporphyrinogen oxidase